nr:hypothetical protein [Serratia odorifera]
MLNNTVIPVLCARAGVSVKDSRGADHQPSRAGVGGHSAGQRAAGDDAA